VILVKPWIQVYMKYQTVVTTEKAGQLIVESLDVYEACSEDMQALTELMSESGVYKYISGEILAKYKIKDVETLATDFLKHSAQRWLDREEMRFCIREQLSRRIVGMIGVDLKQENTNELWYWKSSKLPRFMSEALVAVLSFLRFEEMKSLATSVDSNNIRSQKVIFSVGFVASNNPHLIATLMPAPQENIYELVL
jgi:RimJ/RimL family protein N-acetyltransferase